MTPEQLDKLIDAYAWRCVDDMDIKELRQALAERIIHDFEDVISDDYIIDVIKGHYPELLTPS